MKNHHWTIPQLRRLQELSEAGLSDRSVAIVLSLDYPEGTFRQGSVTYYRRLLGVHRIQPPGRRSIAA